MLDKTKAQELPLGEPEVIEGGDVPPGHTWAVTSRGLETIPITGYSDDADFSWNDRDLIVGPEQPAIAVFHNPRGEIVIRQEGRFGTDEDHWILIQYQNLDPLIERLKEIAKSGPV